MIHREKKPFPLILTLTLVACHGRAWQCRHHRTGSPPAPPPPFHPPVTCPLPVPNPLLPSLANPQGKAVGQGSHGYASPLGPVARLVPPAPVAHLPRDTYHPIASPRTMDSPLCV